MKKAILWFRQDIRLKDNPAYRYAIEHHLSVMPVYIADNTKKFQQSSSYKSEVAYWWNYHALQELNQRLGYSLLAVLGDSKHLILELCKQYEIDLILCNKIYEPFHLQQEEELIKLCVENQLTLKIFEDKLVRLEQITYSYHTFTPFYKKVLAEQLVVLPVDYPIRSANIYSPTAQFSIPKPESSLTYLHEYYIPGETASWHALEVFEQLKLEHYDTKRDFPYDEVTSFLSPYLAHGNISARWIYQSLKHNPQANGFLRQILWGAYAQGCLLFYPKLDTENANTYFNQMSWTLREDWFEKWKLGETGYPLVDAAMKQLSEQHYINNRLRMVVGSFLVKNLNIPWQFGERWFWEKLIDAELSRNVFNWQQVAGTVGPVINFNRVMNPHLQLKKFDPQLYYVREFFPGIEHNSSMNSLPKNYPYKPIVDFYVSRAETLDQFSKLKNQL